MRLPRVSGFCGRLFGQVLFVSLLLSACGGGGGGGGAAPSTSPSTPPITLAAALPAPIATGVTFLPTTYNSSNQLRVSIVSAASGLLFTDSSDAPLKELSLNGLSISSLAGKMGSPENVVVSGQNLYWLDGSRLNKTSIAGAVTTVLSTGTRDALAGATADIVVDGTNAYWVNTNSSTNCSPSCTWTIQAVSLSTGVSSTLVTTSRQIVALVSDASNIYWEERAIEPVTTACSCGSSVKMIAKAGGAISTLVDGMLNGGLPAAPVGQIAASWFPTGGISVSGSRVYFGVSTSTSYQLMGISNAGGVTTVLANVATSVVNAQSAILSINADAANLYWLDTGNGALDTLPLAGGTVSALATGLVSPRALTINSSTAFWTESGALSGCCMQMGAGQIRQVALTGGAVPSTLISGLDAPVALAVDALNIYWTEFWRVADRSINAGGAPITLASGISSGMPRIAADQNNVYILDGDLIKKLPINGGMIEKLSSAHGGSIADVSVVNQDIVTDGINIYWTVMSGLGLPSVQKVPVTGGAVVTLSAGLGFSSGPQDCYWRIAVDTQNVYWSDNSSSFPIGCAVKKVPIAGGASTTLVDAPYLRDFTVDGSNVYYSEFSTNLPTIKKTPVNGGATTTVASNVIPWVLANDSNNVYWIDPSQTALGGIGAVSKTGGTATFLVRKNLETDVLLATEGLAVGVNGLYWTEAVGGKIYTPPVASTLSFPLFNGLKAFAVSGEARTFMISSGCSGTGSINTMPATTPATFGGVSGYASTTTTAWSLSNCTPATYSGTMIDYYDTNYVPLGYDDTASGGSYAVFQGTPIIPASISVGGSGNIGTRTLYASSSKSTVNGKEVLSYVVEPDTAETAVVNLITKTYDASGNLILTTQDRYRIFASGAITRLSGDVQQSYGSILHLILSFN